VSFTSILYGLPSENVAAAYDALVATTEDPDYPAAYLADLNLARPAKLTGSSGSFVWDFGTAQRVDWIAFGPHNLAGGSALFQGNASDSWGAPTLSATVTIPADLRDGQSVNPFRDLTSVTGYTTGGFRYWRLAVATTGVAVAIGEVWLASRKRELRNLRLGGAFMRSRPVVEHRTLYGVSTVYDLGVLYRTIAGDYLYTSTAAADVFTWWHDCHGRTLFSPIVIDQAINDALFVRFTEDMTDQRQQANISRVPIAWDEVSRGLHL